MRLIKALAISSMLALAAPAFAGVLLDFEPTANNSLAELQGIGSYYSSAYGITFAGDAYALIDSDAPGSIGSGNFGNAPSRWTAVWLTQPTNTPSSPNSSFTINVNGGFNSLFSLYYTTTASAVSGNVSLRDAFGLEFASFALPAISRSCAPPTNGDLADNFYCWDNASFDFTSYGKTAYSVQITGSDSDFLFDNMAFGDAVDPTPTVPEPAGLALSLAALGALAWTRRRQRAAR